MHGYKKETLNLTKQFYQKEFYQIDTFVHVFPETFMVKLKCGEMKKQIVWSFCWHLYVAVCHLESNGPAFGTAFMISRV